MPSKLALGFSDRGGERGCVASATLSNNSACSGSGWQLNHVLIADTNYMPTALHSLQQCKTETNIKGYISKISKFKHIIRSSKI